MTTAARVTRTRPDRPDQNTGHRPEADAPRGRSSFRGDIEGMRAVAVLLVVAYHAGLPFITGGYVGVDVFFVLSGFLITGLLVDELGRSGTISFTGFYARRVRRLLPMAAVVLAATVAAAHLLVPPVDRGGVGKEVASAAVWVANWHFAGASTQYMADVGQSPVLHFWSLSVEEQFYLVWPLLLLVLAGGTWLVRRSWTAAIRRVAVGLALIAGVSLVLSWRTTEGDPSLAYFGLHTRAWELAVGAGIALARPALPRLPRRPAVIAGWLGLVMVVGSAAVLDRSTAFPGTAALWPVLGTGLLVATGVGAKGTGPARLLDQPVARFIGRISYSWYLWHWPCLVLANLRWGSSAEVSVGQAPTAPHAAPQIVLAAVALSFVLAVVTHYLVEQPLRHARWFVISRPRSLQLGAVAVAACLAAAWTLHASPAEDAVVAAVPTASAPQSSADLQEVRHTGSPSPSRSAQPVQMTAKQARADMPTPKKGCYVGYAGTKVAPATQCRYGPADGRRSIVLIGDSHATQWEPAMEQIAKRLGWTVYFFAKTACSVIDTPIWLTQAGGAYVDCATWRHQVLQRISEIDDLDAVVIARWSDYRRLALAPDGSRAEGNALFASLWEQGARRTIHQLGANGRRVIMIRDTPLSPQDVPSCLSEHAKKPTSCAFPTAGAAHRDSPLLAAEKAAAGSRLTTVDLTNVICPTRTCQVVTHTGMIKYRDEHHLSAHYSASLWQTLAQGIEHRLPRASS
jgi:peptidoglycan/LPS O-acetylase OafA/YrhL